MCIRDRFWLVHHIFLLVVLCAQHRSCHIEQEQGRNPCCPPPHNCTDILPLFTCIPHCCTPSLFYHFLSHILLVRFSFTTVRSKQSLSFTLNIPIHYSWISYHYSKVVFSIPHFLSACLFFFLYQICAETNKMRKVSEGMCRVHHLRSLDSLKRMFDWTLSMYLAVSQGDDSFGLCPLLTWTCTYQRLKGDRKW